MKNFDMVFSGFSGDSRSDKDKLTETCTTGRPFYPNFRNFGGL